jgi:RNA polymerase sigma factor (sigma-70 family)
MSGGAADEVVFIVDDDHAVRDSLELLLGLRGYTTRTYASGRDFLAEIEAGARGCVLLDLRMREIDGLQVQAALAERAIDLPIIILTAHGDVAAARAALKAGAFDFLEKPIDDNVLTATLQAALARDLENRRRAEHRSVLEQRLARLTPREREVLERVVHGRHNREIAAELGISPRTVEVYKARVMDKLQLDRLSDLIRVALDLGLPTAQNGPSS